MQFYVSNLFHLLFPILLTDDLHRVELSIGAFGRGIFTFLKHSILLLFLLIRMNWARGRVDPRKRCSSVASKIWKEVEVCSFSLRGCSHITSAKIRGSWTPPPPSVSNGQHLAYPPPPLVSNGQHLAYPPLPP